jgi:hypothetical protein
VQAIRIPDEHWGKVWRALIGTGRPLGSIGPPRTYLVDEHQLRMLRRKRLPFEIVPLPNGKEAGRDHV